MTDRPKRKPRVVDTTREYLTVQDVAAHLTIGVSTIWRQVKKGNLPAPIRIGGSTRWKRSKLPAQSD